VGAGGARGAEEAAVAGEGRGVVEDRGHARLGARLVDGEPRAAEGGEVGAQVVGADHHRAAVVAGQAAGHGGVGRAEQGDVACELAREGQAAGLGEHEAGVAQGGGRGGRAVERLGRSDAGGVQGVAQADPEAVGRGPELEPVVHRQGGDHRGPVSGPG
jgi:hypothetical protein